jgi:hypothetical protein
MTRRQMLKSTGLLAGTAVAQAVGQNASTDPISRKAKIVVTGGHPGGPEYARGGHF